MRKAFAALGVAAFTVVVPATRAEAANTTIHIVDNAPAQNPVVINDGDTVTFANDDDVAHAIFAAGAQRGETIPAHTTSGPYTPIVSGDQGGRFDYQVDQNGAPGTIIVAGPPATEPPPPATEPPPTTVPATTAPTTTSTTATTTTTTSTTTTTTSTTVASSSSSSSSSSSGKDSSS